VGRAKDTSIAAEMTNGTLTSQSYARRVPSRGEVRSETKFCASKPTAISRQIAGDIRIRAENLNAARELVIGNPVYEAGGTVEIRELPRTG